MVQRGLVSSRSQAENYIKLGKVKINGRQIAKAGYFVDSGDLVELEQKEQYVSRAGLKLASVADIFELDFRGKSVLDVGSSTGGFTDYALKHGAKKVIAVDVGTNQLHPSLKNNPRIELHEKTDIRDVRLKQNGGRAARASDALRARRDEKPRKGCLITVPAVVLIDVSFISLREVLPAVVNLSKKSTQIVAMLKPQFEAGKEQTNRGVVKNDRLRRQILKAFEEWTKDLFVVVAKADSDISGASGNLERFYLLHLKA